MSKNVGKFTAGRMYALSIKRVFGYSGYDLSAMMGAPNKFKDKVEFIQLSHK